jgi:hypothetical protein
MRRIPSIASLVIATGSFFGGGSNSTPPGRHKKSRPLISAAMHRGLQPPAAYRLTRSYSQEPSPVPMVSVINADNRRQRSVHDTPLSRQRRAGRGRITDEFHEVWRIMYLLRGIGRNGPRINSDTMADLSRTVRRSIMANLRKERRKENVSSTSNLVGRISFVGLDLGNERKGKTELGAGIKTTEPITPSVADYRAATRTDSAGGSAASS